MGYSTRTARPEIVLVSFTQLHRNLRTPAPIMQESTLSEAVSVSEARFDVLTTTTSDLCKRLEEGSITSVQIVETYLAQTAEHNVVGAKCRAVISTPPRSLIISQASRLDKERAEGRVVGHFTAYQSCLKYVLQLGLVESVLSCCKDVFATDISLGMPTTAGSCALLDSRLAGNADVVDNVTPPVFMGESS